tara:strand:- start:184 stop:285 length:102 start_codon:yes stop_codon:yes gene_type:complete
LGGNEKIKKRLPTPVVVAQAYISKKERYPDFLQ